VTPFRALVAVVAFANVLALAGRDAAARADRATPAVAHVVYGHHHLNVTSVDAHRKFWVDGLGGVEATRAGLPVAMIRVSNVLVLLRQQPPTGVMADSLIPQIGFTVRSLAETAKRLNAAGYQVTNADRSAGVVIAPDGLAIRLVEDSAAHEAIAARDVQFSVQDPDAVQAWYTRTFGASAPPTAARGMVALPNLSMIFRRANGRPAGTRGGVLDHLGFEVDHLEQFCAGLAGSGITFDRPYTKIASANLAVAFLMDPWGTYIELTEGLNPIQ